MNFWETYILVISIFGFSIQIHDFPWTWSQLEKGLSNEQWLKCISNRIKGCRIAKYSTYGSVKGLCLYFRTPGGYSEKQVQWRPLKLAEITSSGLFFNDEPIYQLQHLQKSYWYIPTKCSTSFLTHIYNKLMIMVVYKLQKGQKCAKLPFSLSFVIVSSVKLW